MSETTTSGKFPLSYNFQRTLWPLVAGFTAFLLWHNDLVPGDNAAIPAFVAYVATGLFYDWVVFSYLKYRDSNKFTDEQWALSNLKAHEVDKLNEFYTMARRFAFAASVSATAGCYLFFPDMSVLGSFFFAYTGITIFLISIGVFTKDIVFRFSLRNGVPVESNKSLFSDVFATDTTSDNPALNPLWFHRR